MQKILYSQIINHLKAGGLIVYPTETAYGLGADATNQKAVDLVFKIKKRSKKKTLPVIASSFLMVDKYCQISKLEKQIAKKYWPGALTLVLKIKNIKLANGVISKDKTLAIRISSNKIAKNIAQKLGNPIVSTSANLSGEGECYNFLEIEKNFSGLKKIMLIDGGKLLKRKSSTIARINKGDVEILRQGDIKIKI